MDAPMALRPTAENLTGQQSETSCNPSTSPRYRRPSYFGQRHTSTVCCMPALWRLDSARRNLDRYIEPPRSNTCTRLCRDDARPFRMVEASETEKLSESGSARNTHPFADARHPIS